MEGVKKIRKIETLLMGVLITALVLAMAACGNSGNSANTLGTTASTTSDATQSTTHEASTIPAQKVSVDFGMAAWGNEVEGWTVMIDAANKKLLDKNIEIKITKIPVTSWQEYYQKIITQMAAGNAPDIGRAAEKLLPQLISKGQVVDLTDYMKDLNMSQYYERTFQSSLIQKGKYYGLPSGAYYMLLYYNKDLFKEAGLPEPSKDWNNASSFDLVREYAKKLSSGEGSNKIFGFMGHGNSEHMGAYALSNGGKYVYNEDGTPAINDEISKGVYKWMDDMLRVDKTMPSPTITKVMSATDLFKAGKLAMYTDGTWDQQTMKAITNFKVGIAAMPAGKGKAYSPQYIDAFVMFKGTKHEKETWEALKAIFSKEGFDALAPTGTGGIPIVKATVENNKDLLFGTNFDESDIKCFYDGFDHVLGVPYREYSPEYESKEGNILDEWTLGKITSDQLANKLNDAMVKTIADYKQ